MSVLRIDMKLRSSLVTGIGAARNLWDSLDHFTAIEYATPLSLVTIATGVQPALRAKLVEAGAGAIDGWSARTEAGKAVLVRFREGTR